MSSGLEDTSPAVVLYDNLGNKLAVQDGVVIPANTPGLLATGIDRISGKARTLSTDPYGNLAITLPASANLDAFGRLRVGAPQTLFDGKLINDAQPLYWDDQQTSGAGTSSTFNTNQASVTLAVSAATAGTRVRQTFRYFNYQPGKGQIVAMTGVLGAPAAGITARAGLFDGDNGVFFEASPTTPQVVIRTKGTGVVVDHAVPQAAWNIDKFNGAGPSGITLNLAKTQIFVIDYQWLGTGTVRYGFFVNGTLYYCHAVHHANLDTIVYMSSPNLPARWEISNDGTGGVASVTQICTTVVSEGGSNQTGGTRGQPRTAGFVTLNDTGLYPVVAIRLRAGFKSADIRPLGLSVICTTTADFIWYLIMNPTIVGAALVFTAVANSAIEADVVATNATKLTGGTILASDVVSQSSGPGATVADPTDVQPGVNIAGVSDIMVLAAQRVTGGVETFFGSMTWRETV